MLVVFLGLHLALSPGFPPRPMPCFVKVLPLGLGFLHALLCKVLPEDCICVNTMDADFVVSNWTDLN